MATTLKTLESRIVDLESKLQMLVSRVPPSATDWRQAVGMFSEDSLMQAIFTQGKQIRQQNSDQPRTRRKPLR